MALDPAPTVLGPAAAPQVEPTLADDGARLRQTAQRQWAARRDLERQLHDGAALRISALTLRLGPAAAPAPRRRAASSRPPSRSCRTSCTLVLQELRDVAGRLYPPLLDEAGLGPALREVADRGTAPVRIDAPDERFGPAAEGAAYFAVLGCLDADGARSRPSRSSCAARPTTSSCSSRASSACQTVVADGRAACRAACSTVRPAGSERSTSAGGSDVGTITVRIPCE